MRGLRDFLNWIVAGATAGGIIGGVGAAYKFIDDSMKPTPLQNQIFDSLLVDVPSIAISVTRNQRGGPEEDKHWKNFLVTRSNIGIVTDPSVKEIVVRFTIAHDADQRADKSCYNQIRDMAEVLAECIGYASYGAPRAIEALTGGRVLLVSHGRCSAEKVAYLTKAC